MVTDFKTTDKVSDLFDTPLTHFGQTINLAQIKFLSKMLKAIVILRTVNFAKLAMAFGGEADALSSMRRIQRFMADYDLDLLLVARLIFKLLPHKRPYILSMDRTNWQFRSFDINALVLAVTYQGVAFPLLFRLLPKKGNSKSSYLSTNPRRLWNLITLQVLARGFFMSMEEFITHQEPLPRLAEGQSSDLAEDFLNLVELEYRRHRDLSYYAGRLCKSAKYLSRVIMEATGRSATDWIERCVIMDAKAQLSSTQKRVSEISDDLNFASPSFFGKYFKRLTGLSPKAFREAEKPYVS